MNASHQKTQNIAKKKALPVPI